MVATTKTRIPRVAIQPNGLDEQVVKSFGFKYKVKDIPLSEVNFEATQRVNKRIGVLDDDRVIRYAIGMSQGNAFPAAVVHTEPTVQGYVVDSGTHRFHAANAIDAETFSACVLEVDLNDPTQANQLDLLRFKLNLEHGAALSNLERSRAASEQVLAGTMTIDQAADFFQVDRKWLENEYAEYQNDLELRRYGLHPDNFLRRSDKQAVLRLPNVRWMKALERILVEFNGQSGQRAVTSTEVQQAVKEIVACKDDAKSQQVIDNLREELSKKKKTATRKSTQANPRFHLEAVAGNAPKILTSAILTTINDSVDAAKVEDKVYGSILRLVELQNAVAKKWGLPQVTIDR